jgi:hypothetical protein
VAVEEASGRQVDGQNGGVAVEEASGQTAWHAVLAEEAAMDVCDGDVEEAEKGGVGQGTHNKQVEPQAMSEGEVTETLADEDAEDGLGFAEEIVEIVKVPMVKRKATKRYVIDQPPRVLTLHLKR